jgi:alcohol dehydrogenase (cytochrome c)
MSIRNPFSGASDLERGSLLFNEHCATCHGQVSRDPSAPNLATGMLKQGRSDWAMFRTIRDGIAGTAMAAHPLADEDLWRLVAWVQKMGADAAETGPAEPPAPAYEPVSAERLSRAGQQNFDDWLTYSGDYRGNRHTRLDEVTPQNVRDLKLIWAFQTGGPSTLEVTPLVNRGFMFLTIPPNRIVALDAASGRELWRQQWELAPDLKICCGAQNRGVALADDKVFVGTWDARLLAFDAATGKPRWQAQLTPDYAAGYNITSAPLVVKDKVIVGVSGGEYGTRGFLDAYQVATGKRIWRVYTVPAPGEPGHETWGGASWKTGGAAPWMTGSYDEKLKLLFWGTGNPTPTNNPDARPGDNLYANSVLALDPDTGALRWYFQFTPRDGFGWDAAQVPVLVDLEQNGQPRRVLAWANRNGFYYLLDGQTGQFLMAASYTLQTWANGIARDGRPEARAEARPTEQGVLVYPGEEGGTNWWSSSYSPETRLLYAPVLEQPMIFVKGDATYHPGEFYFGGSHNNIAGKDHTTAVVAISVENGKVVWRRELGRRQELPTTGGVLSTSTGVLFVGDARLFRALDASTGDVLWVSDLGGPIKAAPVSYATGGKQRITVAADRTLFTFGIDP